MMTLFLMAAAIAAADTDAPRGFTATGLARQTAVSEAGLSQVRVQADLIRTGLIGEPQKTLAALDPAEAAAIVQATGDLDGEGGAYMAWFMRGASVMAMPRGDSWVVGYYNPFVDACLVLRFQPTEAGPRVQVARLVEGATLRRSTGMWTDDAAPFTRLAGDYAGTVAGFKTLFNQEAPLRLTSLPDGFTATGMRTRQWMTSLGAWRAGEAQTRAAQAVADAVAVGRLSRLGIGNADLAAQIDSLPATLRRDLAVTAAIADGDTTRLVFVAPQRPDLWLIVDFKNGVDATGFTLVNLANTQGDLS